MNIEKLVSDAKRKAQAALANANVTPSPRIVREKSLSEQRQEYARPGVGLLLCVHSVCYFVECSACRRSVEDAKANFVRFIAKQATQGA